jgi:hypothetical protein
MRTQDLRNEENNSKKLFHAMDFMPGIALLVILATAGFNTKAIAQKVHVNINVEIPVWAPYHDNAHQVRYYYFPDIESYYDLRSREFVFLHNGVWVFSRSLPAAYAWFNLRNSFVVALDYRVYEPWRHFNYYVAHYPRYYYHSKYKNRHWDNDRPLRGFNENERREVYNHRSDMDYYNSRDRRDEERKESRNRNDNYNRDDKRNDNRSHDAGRYSNPERGSNPTERTAPVEYKGKNLGKPVKVQKSMKETRIENKGNNRESGKRQR